MFLDVVGVKKKYVENIVSFVLSFKRLIAGVAKSLYWNLIETTI